MNAGTATKKKRGRPPGKKKAVASSEIPAEDAGEKGVAEIEAASTVTIPRIDVKIATIPIIGDTRLVCHNWDQKAIQEMEDKHFGRPKQPKGKRNAKAEYQASLYKHPDGGFGFPASAFKKAAVDACSFIPGVTKVIARGAFHVVGDLVKIVGKPNMRKDVVRIGQGIATTRYRGEFKKWKTELTVRYDANVITPEQIANLLNYAGFAIGVGEGRPQKSSDQSWGAFHVALAG